MVRAALRGRLSWRVARLTATHDETATARTLIFAVPGWPGNLGGQHVDVRLTAEDGYSTQRSYSIASAADGDAVQLTVQVVPDGEVSTYLGRELTIGSAIELRGPIGGWFAWRPSDIEPLLLIAGGSGVVPLMAIVRARRATGSRVPCRLLYSARTPNDVLYADELTRSVREDQAFDLTLLYTRATVTPSVRPARRINAEDITVSGWSAGFAPRCYVCGPTGFVESMSALLVDLGHRADDIRTERFG